MKEENIAEYLLRVNDIVNSIRALQEDLDDK
jgi:hypothetical protein